MLDIDKEELRKKFLEEDWNYIFDKAYQISDFLIYHKFKIYDPDIASDIRQECVENLLKKIVKNKIDGNNNVFSFIWKNSTYRILEILRKERNRKKIATFMSFDLMDYEIYKNDDISERYAFNE